jgi:hypothetical protein
MKESQEENLPENNENKTLGKLKYGYEKSENQEIMTSFEYNS